MTHLERLAKSYEVENFFDYIFESYVNGNYEQVRELAKKLKRNELVAFCKYCLVDLDINATQDRGFDLVNFLTR